MFSMHRIKARYSQHTTLSSVSAAATI